MPVYRLLPLLLLLVPAAAAQEPLRFTRTIDAFPVVDVDGEALPFGLFGGFNNPRPQLVDIDGDGDRDLFLLEEAGRLMFYENVADGPGFELAWRSDRWLGLDPGTWFRFGDLDGDGDLDLLTNHRFGQARYYRNTGTRQQPAFELAEAPLLAEDGRPVSAEDPNTPGLADLDGDGDLDLYMGQGDNGFIVEYEQVRLDGGVPRFRRASERFQDIVIYEGNPSCEIQPGRPVLEMPPPGLGLPGAPGGAPGADGTRGTLHGANAVAFADIDADGDLDMFWGDFFSPSVYFFENRGTPQEPDMEVVSSHFPLENPLATAGYNAPDLADLDGDGDTDFLFGILGGFCSTTANLIDNLYLFENAGSDADPDFRFRTGRLIRGYDVGKRTIPALVDLDGDGDLDVVLGNETDPADPTSARLHLLENTGTPTAPVLAVRDTDWLGLRVGFNYAPAFGDLDGDGDADLLVGKFDGRLAYLRNDGHFGEIAFTLVDEDLGGLDVGQLASPALGDLDADGDLDLVVGEFDGTLNLVRNAGSPTEPAFEIEATRWLDVDAGRYAVPRLHDVDGDGDLDLFVGSDENGTLFFRNVGTPFVPEFAAEDAALGVRLLQAPAFGDLDGDGDADLLQGTAAGGLTFLRSERVVGTETGAAVPPGPRLDIFPNPSDGAVTFAVRDAGRAEADAALRVVDAAGRTVWEAPVTAGEERRWPRAAALASGVYVVLLVAGGRVVAQQKWTRLKD